MCGTMSLYLLLDFREAQKFGFLSKHTFKFFNKNQNQQTTVKIERTISLMHLDWYYLTSSSTREKVTKLHFNKKSKFNFNENKSRIVKQYFDCKLECCWTLAKPNQTNNSIINVAHCFQRKNLTQCWLQIYRAETIRLKASALSCLINTILSLISFFRRIPENQLKKLIFKLFQTGNLKVYVKVPMVTSVFARSLCFSPTWSRSNQYSTLVT